MRGEYPTSPRLTPCGPEPDWCSVVSARLLLPTGLWPSLDGHEGDPLKIGEGSITFSVLAVGETLWVLVGPDLEDATALLRFLHRPQPQLVPHPGARVPQEDPRLRF